MQNHSAETLQTMNLNLPVEKVLEQTHDSLFHMLRHDMHEHMANSTDDPNCGKLIAIDGNEQLIVEHCSYTFRKDEVPDSARNVGLFPYKAKTYFCKNFPNRNRGSKDRCGDHLCEVSNTCLTCTPSERQHDDVDCNDRAWSHGVVDAIAYRTRSSLPPSPFPLLKSCVFLFP